MNVPKLVLMSLLLAISNLSPAAGAGAIPGIIINVCKLEVVPKKDGARILIPFSPEIPTRFKHTLSPTEGPIAAINRLCCVGKSSERLLKHIEKTGYSCNKACWEFAYPSPIEGETALPVTGSEESILSFIQDYQIRWAANLEEGSADDKAMAALIKQGWLAINVAATMHSTSDEGQFVEAPILKIKIVRAYIKLKNGSWHEVVLPSELCETKSVSPSDMIEEHYKAFIGDIKHIGVVMAAGFASGIPIKPPQFTYGTMLEGDVCHLHIIVSFNEDDEPPLPPYGVSVRPSKIHHHSFNAQGK